MHQNCKTKSSSLVQLVKLKLASVRPSKSKALQLDAILKLQALVYYYLPFSNHCYYYY